MKKADTKQVEDTCREIKRMAIKRTAEKYLAEKQHRAGKYCPIQQQSIMKAIALQRRNG